MALDDLIVHGSHYKNRNVALFYVPSSMVKPKNDIATTKRGILFHQIGMIFYLLAILLVSNKIKAN